MLEGNSTSQWYQRAVTSPFLSRPMRCLGIPLLHQQSAVSVSGVECQSSVPHSSLFSCTRDSPLSTPYSTFYSLARVLLWSASSSRPTFTSNYCKATLYFIISCYLPIRAFGSYPDIVITLLVITGSWFQTSVWSQSETGKKAYCKGFVVYNVRTRPFKTYAVYAYCMAP